MGANHQLVQDFAPTVAVPIPNEFQLVGPCGPPQPHLHEFQVAVTTDLSVKTFSAVNMGEVTHTAPAVFVFGARHGEGRTFCSKECCEM